MSSKQWKSLCEIGNFTFLFKYGFFVFRKSMKNDDFRSLFGMALVVVLVIFIKFQG